MRPLGTPEVLRTTLRASPGGQPALGGDPSCGRVVRRTTVCKYKEAGRTNRFRSTHGSRVAAYGRHPLGLRGGRLQRASRLKEPQALRYNTRCPTRVRTTSAIANRLTNVGGGACGCLQTASAPQGRPRRKAGGRPSGRRPGPYGTTLTNS